MRRLRNVYGPGFTRAEYLRTLAAGHEAGCWDHNGIIPAPWPLGPQRQHPGTWPDDYDENAHDPQPSNHQDGGQPAFLISKTRDQPTHHSPGLDPRSYPPASALVRFW